MIEIDAEALKQIFREDEEAKNGAAEELKKIKLEIEREKINLSKQRNALQMQRLEYLRQQQAEAERAKKTTDKKADNTFIFGVGAMLAQLITTTTLFLIFIF